MFELESTTEALTVFANSKEHVGRVRYHAPTQTAFVALGAYGVATFDVSGDPFVPDLAKVRYRPTPQVIDAVPFPTGRLLLSFPPIGVDDLRGRIGVLEDVDELETAAIRLHALPFQPFAVVLDPSRPAGAHVALTQGGLARIDLTEP